eukprot:gene54111-26767_t
MWVMTMLVAFFALGIGGRLEVTMSTAAVHPPSPYPPPAGRSPAGGARAAAELLLGGYRGVRVGEAKTPGKGPASAWGIMSSNVTSLNAPLRESEVAAFDAEVIGLQECRLTKEGQKTMSRSLLLAGWRTIWGCPQAPRPRRAGEGYSPWDAEYGGVG